MSVPAFLNSSFRYLLVAGVTDVATIITSFESEVLANSPAWTKNSAGDYTSPANANGRWFEVILTRIDQYTLDLLVKTWTGVSIISISGHYRMQIDTSATNVRIFTGQYHFHIQSDRSTPEHLCGGMLDLTPEAQDAHTVTIWAHGFRKGDSTTTYNDLQYSSMNDDQTVNSGVVRPFCVGNATQMHMTSFSGAYLFEPVRHAKYNDWRQYGRRYQYLMCDSGLSSGAVVTVPIDAGVTGNFIVLGVPATGYTKACLRSA